MRKFKPIESILLLFLVAALTMGAAKVFDASYFRDVVTFGKTVTFNQVPKTTNGNGAGVTGATAVEYGTGLVHKTVLTLSKDITTTDSAGTGGYGSFKLYDFPAGAVEVLGTSVNLTATSASGSTHGLVAAADGDFALGTAACNAGSLTSTEADILSSTSIAQFANTAGIVTGYAGTATALDGTATAKDLYLNVIFDDADSSGADDIVTAGTVTVYWINLGDY